MKKKLAIGALALAPVLARADIISDTVDAAEASATLFQTIAGVILTILTFMIGIKYAKRAAAKV